MRFLFCLIFTPIAWAQVNVQQVVDAFAQDPVNRHANISFQAIDMTSGEVIANYKGNNAIPSASTTKLFTTATAFELLGEQYRMHTRIYCDGFIDKDSVLHGNIWIRGGGDVSLGSKFFSFENQELNFLTAWADSLKSKGIKFIEGSVIADASEFGYNGTPKSWQSGDVGNYYGAFAGGINFYDNTVKLRFQTGAVGTTAQYVGIYPEIPGFQLDNQVKAANIHSDETIIYGGAYEFNRRIKGTLPSHTTNFVVKGSMPDPENQLAIEWVKVLLLNGIQVEDGAKGFRSIQKDVHTHSYANKTLLFQVEGQTVGEIAKWTNLKSVNLFADGLVNAMAFQKTGKGDFEQGLRQINDYWSSKINLTGFQIYDGCGLSRSNTISAAHFCDLLKAMSSSSNAEVFKNTLPIAGKTGTAKSLCKGDVGEGRVFAKSGSMQGVKSFAGYVDSVTGRKIAFAIIVNDFNCSGNQLTIRMEKILNALAQY
ncbi:MAG: D-alanyl-D-alanine carboxypeptidase/D-alanyl-D-alanine-endopeptidase [Flavobacteriales bacterium]